MAFLGGLGEGMSQRLVGGYVPLSEYEEAYYRDQEPQAAVGGLT